MLHAFRIHPQAFEVVELTLVGLEHMHHNIYVVDQCPCRSDLGMKRLFITGLTYFLFNVIGNGLDLDMRLRFAEKKKIRYRLFDFSQIERNDFFPFFIVNGFQDGLK